MTDDPEPPSSTDPLTWQVFPCPRCQRSVSGTTKVCPGCEWPLIPEIEIRISIEEEPPPRPRLIRPKKPR